ncbi:MAG: hypothetical protein ACJ749_08470 [Flavisolibacter sp.]
MPRQNFLSRESFVDASEKQAKDSILSIPAFVSNIHFVSENKMVGLTRFTYEQSVKNVEYIIDVSVLPLNDQYTRVSLHGTHVNGQSFQNDSDMLIALHDFEAAMQAALKGDISLYSPYQPKPGSSKKFLQFASAFVASVGVFFLKKKLS